MHTALSIAGSDCSGGAGIQADLKAFSANGVYGQTAIVALVDENTEGVYDIMKVAPRFVAQQIRTCLSDIGADAIKIGMLDDADVVRSVKDALLEFESYKGVRNIVLDPVMVSTSGHKLLEDSAIEVVVKELFPLARVITPNLPEAEILLNRKIKRADFGEAARELSKLGKSHRLSVLLKAGHLEDTDGSLIDFFYNAETGELLELNSQRVTTNNTHGTGCTLSAAFAAHLAQGESLNDAARLAKKYIAEAVAAAKDLKLGKGHGPVHHFYRWW